MDYGPVKQRLIELSRYFLDKEINDTEYFQELMREVFASEDRGRALHLIAYAIHKSGD